MKVQRVLVAALAEWEWPERLPKRLRNPLSALRRVAPVFEGALLGRFSTALRERDEAALVAAVWEACGRVSRARGQRDAPLTLKTRRRYYYEFTAWVLA